MNKYITYSTAQCPNNGSFDYYKIILKSKQTIQVEEINGFIKSFDEFVFQESLADKLSETFPAEIKIIGYHQGIKIISRRNKIN